MFQKHASQPIIYRRGKATLAFNATPGKTEYPADEQSGIYVTYFSNDWIFPVALLTLDPSTPQLGDMIETVDGKIFSVTLPNSTEQAFKIDPFDVNYRVHTKQTT